MLPQVKIFIILFLLFDFSLSGKADNSMDDKELTYSSGQYEMMKGLGGRKLLIALDAMLDYEEPRANPSHEPRKGNGGGRGGNNP